MTRRYGDGHGRRKLLQSKGPGSLSSGRAPHRRLTKVLVVANTVEEPEKVCNRHGVDIAEAAADIIEMRELEKGKRCCTWAGTPTSSLRRQPSRMESDGVAPWIQPRVHPMLLLSARSSGRRCRCLLSSLSRPSPRPTSP
ncbi:hypothetical protein ZWY2020_001339 [Hordeum vulgare]|nr:hypothetical protein ZWY2020_001339 [Hordeum vulgare]